MDIGNYPRIKVIPLPDNDFDRRPGSGEKRQSRVKRQTGWRPGGFARHDYASTPRESNAPGPDHK